MFSTDRGISGITNLVLKESGAFKKATFTTLNVEKLKGVLSYFSYLHANGEISDKAFENLVSHAYSIFIENEVEEIIQETLERKLVRFFETKFSLIDEENSNREESIYALKAARLIRSR